MENIDKIKARALQNNIPIIMDDTLEVISKYLNKLKPKSILEIGTAVRIFCNLFFQIFIRRWKNRYNRT